LIVDDSPQYVEAARNLLERHDITIVGVASTLAEALRCHDALRPDVTLVDIDLGAESGFAVVEQLGRAPTILISTHDEQDMADLIADSPALGFVHKSVLTAKAIHDLVDGLVTPR
jgi:DNA-binding NarL/FixJ family response regulator